MLRPLASPRAAGVIGYVTLLLIGWSGLLVPSLIRSIEPPVHLQTWALPEGEIPESERLLSSAETGSHGAQPLR